jgi:phosphoglycolate phosphatase
MYEYAFPTATGKPFGALANVAGRTELDIMRETLEQNDVSSAESQVQKLAAELVRAYEENREQLAERGRALPGALDALRALHAEPAVHQSVLTGNLRQVARIKLEVFGLERFVDLDSGAYGEDGSERYQLVEVAQGRATERTGISFDGEHTVLIGDTPKDVEAALLAGVRIIGVATGKTDEATLRKAGATTVVSSLMPTQDLVRYVMTLSSIER